MPRRYIRPRLSDLSGNVLRGGWLRVLDTDEDEVDVFAAQSGGDPLEQPLTTDLRGEVEVWLATGTGDVLLEWEDSGATYASGTSRRMRFATFREFMAAPPAGGGGSGLHADLTDLEESGHPASIIDYDGTVLAGIGVGGVANVQDLDLAWAALGGFIGQVSSVANDAASAAAAAQGDADAAGTAAAAAQATADGAIQDPGGSNGQFLSRVSGAWAAVPNPGGGGGGLDVYPSPVALVSGFLSGPGGRIDTVAVADGTGLLILCPVGRAVHVEQLRCDITGASGGGVARLGVFGVDPASGMPGALLCDGGPADASSTGVKEFDVDLDLVPGAVWLYVANQGPAAFQIRGVADGNGGVMPTWGDWQFGFSGLRDGLCPAGALPDPFETAFLGDYRSTGPKIMLLVT